MFVGQDVSETLFSGGTDSNKTPGEPTLILVERVKQ